MNFRSLILIAGVVAVATASSPAAEEDSNKMAQSQEEESNKMVETECHPGPSRCAPCFSALKKRNLRYRQIIAWRNSQRSHIGRWYSAQAKYRAAKLRYYSHTFYRARLAQYYAKHRWINRVVASWTKTMHYKYNNCK
jgi:hypothetical protein